MFRRIWIKRGRRDSNPQPLDRQKTQNTAYSWLFLGIYPHFSDAGDDCNHSRRISVSLGKSRYVGSRHAAKTVVYRRPIATPCDEPPELSTRHDKGCGRRIRPWLQVDVAARRWFRLALCSCLFLTHLRAKLAPLASNADSRRRSQSVDGGAKLHRIAIARWEGSGRLRRFGSRDAGKPSGKRRGGSVIERFTTWFHGWIGREDRPQRPQCGISTLGEVGVTGC